MVTSICFAMIPDVSICTMVHMDISGIMAQPHPFDHLPWPVATSSQRDKICWDVATSRDASAN